MKYEKLAAVLAILRAKEGASVDDPRNAVFMQLQWLYGFGEGTGSWGLERLSGLKAAVLGSAGFTPLQCLDGFGEGTGSWCLERLSGLKAAVLPILKAAVLPVPGGLRWNVDAA